MIICFIIFSSQQGSVCNACRVVCWFPFCVAIEMRNELRNRELASEKKTHTHTYIDK